ncbi:hypothetical protein GGR09_000765 [Bartonella heixiaziensis]
MVVHNGIYHYTIHGLRREMGIRSIEIKGCVCTIWFIYSIFLLPIFRSLIYVFVDYSSRNSSCVEAVHIYIKSANPLGALLQLKQYSTVLLGIVSFFFIGLQNLYG